MQTPECLKPYPRAIYLMQRSFLGLVLLFFMISVNPTQTSRGSVCGARNQIGLFCLSHCGIASQFPGRIQIRGNKPEKDCLILKALFCFVCRRYKNLSRLLQFLARIKLIPLVRLKEIQGNTHCIVIEQFTEIHFHLLHSQASAYSVVNKIRRESISRIV